MNAIASIEQTINELGVEESLKRNLGRFLVTLPGARLSNLHIIAAMVVRDARRAALPAPELRYAVERLVEWCLERPEILDFAEGGQLEWWPIVAAVDV